jgi:hypothetical protein
VWGEIVKKYIETPFQRLTVVCCILVFLAAALTFYLTRTGDFVHLAIVGYNEHGQSNVTFFTPDFFWKCEHEGENELWRDWLGEFQFICMEDGFQKTQIAQFLPELNGYVLWNNLRWLYWFLTPVFQSVILTVIFGSFLILVRRIYIWILKGQQ